MPSPIPATISDSELKTWLKPRPPYCHKGDFGSAGIIGGAPGMAGAPLLAGRAALWLGAGRVYCGLLDTRVAVDTAVPELMLTTPEHVLSLAPPACLVVGPGLGQSKQAHALLQAALVTLLPLLLDADALNLVSGDMALADSLRARTSPTLLTPHPGEAGRLLGSNAKTVQADRNSAVLDLVARYGCGAVLKGMGSLIALPGGTLWRNTTGNPGMAAPGMGDVLAGMIAALTAQGLPLDKAAVAGVYLHGVAADRAVADGLGPIGLTASEVARAARGVLNDLT